MKHAQSTAMTYFKNKRVLLTGGTDGIGLAVANKLAEAGAECLIIGRRETPEFSDNSQLNYLSLDLATPDFTEVIEDWLVSANWQELDMLIHNAGLGFVGQFQEDTPRAIQALVDVNLKAPILLTRRLANRLLQAKGQVCFVGSTLSGRATPNFALYTATKTGLTDFARNLRNEWQGRAHVQVFHPGPTLTEFHAKSGLENPPMQSLFMRADEVADDLMQMLESRQTMKRLGIPKMLQAAIKRRFSKGAA